MSKKYYPQYKAWTDMPPDAKCESRKSKYVTASVVSSASKAKASTLELGEGGGVLWAPSAGPGSPGGEAPGKCRFFDP